MVLFGIPVLVHWTTLILAALVIADACIYISKAQNEKKKGVLAAAVTITIFVILSVVLHEAAHAVTAAMFGIKIVSAGIHGLGAYVATTGSLAEFGWFAEFCVAFAGPAANILLALLAALIVYLFPESLAENTVQYFGYINAKLARMNLWPIFILDGAKVLHGLTWAIFGASIAPWIVTAAGVATVIWLFSKKKGRKEIEDIFMTL